MALSFRYNNPLEPQLISDCHNCALSISPTEFFCACICVQAGQVPSQKHTEMLSVILLPTVGTKTHNINCNRGKSDYF